MDVKLVEETCCREGCGILFWIAADYQARLVSSKRSFYCPNGHSMSYTGESDAWKIRRLEQEKAQILREKDAEIERVKKECAKKKRKKK